MPEYELYHHGVKGMKWGVKKKYRSTSVRSAIARRQNAKVDKSFKQWNENAKLKENAIELGKKANDARLNYENNRSDKQAKSAYKTANSDYKKALRSNTTYRKGAVRQEVGRDASRKYLSEAKKVQKLLNADPSNKALQKRYTELMNKHDTERASARRAAEVGAKRSSKKAALKRTMTKTVKAVAVTAGVTAGVAAVNKMLQKKGVSIGSDKVSSITDMAKKAKDFIGYMY